MMRRRGMGGSTAVLVLASAVALGACGSSSKNSSSSSSSSSSSGGGAGAASLSLTISETGKTASYRGPSSAQGGVVQLTLRNAGHQPHAAQLIRVDPPHTIAEALKIVGGGTKTPAWIHAEGGLGSVFPGATGTSTVNLTPGHYAVADIGGPGSGGPPAVKQLTISGGSSSGSLPSTPTTITAAAPGKDKYTWQISGSVQSGASQITFASKGNNTVHLIAAARITGKHSDAELVKALGSNGPPPSFVDPRSLASTAVLDSGKSLVTSLALRQPGTYVLFCPLTDRDGGKPHLAEGLLTTVTVK